MNSMGIMWVSQQVTFMFKYDASLLFRFLSVYLAPSILSLTESIQESIRVPASPDLTRRQLFKQNFMIVICADKTDIKWFFGLFLSLSLSLPSVSNRQMLNV